MAGVEQMDNILSIHAPTRGATLQFRLLTVLVYFQSTLLQEERPVAFEFWVRAFYLSIHAPTRGATFY